MSATSSKTDKGNGEARSRDHNQGNQDRKYTLEQKAAVIRVRRCSPTAFYEILDLESVRTTVTENEIKKAYRKLSLLTHPDKNGHEYADEAFKMVSRAFGVLGDKEKREKYDRFGGDPDSRFGGGGGSAPQSSPFGGFAGRAASGGHQGAARGAWDDEISPEEMFNRFFGGGGMGGGFGGFGGNDPSTEDIGTVTNLHRWHVRHRSTIRFQFGRRSWHTCPPVRRPKTKAATSRTGCRRACTNVTIDHHWPITSFNIVYCTAIKFSIRWRGPGANRASIPVRWT
jgi:hypothetical protein